ncbi:MULTISPECIES: tyrosine-type recombinase/integrase [Streptomyces]|uniref:tyrosine-type recombinase/integrase n=1 Tax=Streptomyces TaxID=1883 RepID=UPI0018ACF428|nr:site-specific integrase [Streptomyces sp. BRB081]MBL3808545.1 site-specific integrase [Streptomyces sp. BRB081]
MPGYVEDRWFTKRPDPETGERRKTARHGQGKRYRVAGVPGIRDRSFDRLTGPEGANAWLAKAQHESTRGEFIDPRDGNTLLRDYVEQEWWPSRNYTDPSTIEAVKGSVFKHIVPHLGGMSLNAIRTPQLRTWLATLAGTLGPGTINDVWGTLSSILQSAVDDERITKNYCKAQRTVRPPARPAAKARAWPRDRVVRARDAISDRARITLDLAVGAGLRQGEVFGLAADDIDFEEQVIHVRRQVKKVGPKLIFAPPKGGKVRTVPAAPLLLDRLAEGMAAFPPSAVTLPWLSVDPPANDREARERAPRTVRLAAPAPRGGAWRRDYFNAYVWKPTLESLGLVTPEIVYRPVATRPGGKERRRKYGESRELGFHALRHTFASAQLDAGESVVSVSKWMGHSSPEITLKIYAHFMPEADGRGRAIMQKWLDF